MFFLKRYKHFTHATKRSTFIHTMRYGYARYGYEATRRYNVMYQRANQTLIDYSVYYTAIDHDRFIHFIMGNISIDIYITDDRYSFTFGKTIKLPNGMKQTISYKGNAKQDKDGIILKFPMGYIKI